MAQKKLHITAHNQHGLVHNTQGTKTDIEKWFKKLDDPMVWWVQIIDEEGKEIGSKKPGKGAIVWRAAKRSGTKKRGRQHE